MKIENKCAITFPSHPNTDFCQPHDKTENGTISSGNVQL